jgi:hypothetical protein
VLSEPVWARQNFVSEIRQNCTRFSITPRGSTVRFYFVSVYYLFFYSVFCILSVRKLFFFYLYFFSYVTIHHAASKKQKSNHLPSMSECSSALDIHTMMPYQRFQALCAITHIRSHRMLMLSIILDRIMTIYFSFYIVVISPF